MPQLTPPPPLPVWPLGASPLSTRASPAPAAGPDPLKSALRALYKLVHPDLFLGHTQAQVGRGACGGVHAVVHTLGRVGRQGVAEEGCRHRWSGVSGVVGCTSQLSPPSFPPPPCPALFSPPPASPLPTLPEPSLPCPSLTPTHLTPPSLHLCRRLRTNVHSSSFRCCPAVPHVYFICCTWVCCVCMICCT